MDNCATHKSNALLEVIEAAGRRLVFLPPYSPDFSPIEESFSCGMILPSPCVAKSTSIHPLSIFLVKSHLRRYYHRFTNSRFPEHQQNTFLLDSTCGTCGLLEQLGSKKKKLPRTVQASRIKLGEYCGVLVQVKISCSSYVS